MSANRSARGFAPRGGRPAKSPRAPFRAAELRSSPPPSPAGINDSDAEPCCVVCFKRVDIYSVGECDHPVCFECSTRMRVLCLQNECPICRQHLQKVIFTPECAPYKEIGAQRLPPHFFESKYKIGFVNEAVKKAYTKLLEHNCKECKGSVGPFKDFDSLKDHMMSHDLQFCDLCVANLKIFTFERKCYTKPQLNLHRKKGDPDDSSHKGHPLCEFCDVRYMDTDELYRHLRKHHLYCHLCDADGFDHYYGSYSCLRDHFRKEHHLCEEGECSEQNLTAVFRTDIDLKAHKALEHGRGLSKQAARQARTLEVQFTITPRPPRPQRSFVPPQVRPEWGEDHCSAEPTRDEPRNVAPLAIDTGSKEQFPSLGDSTPAPVLTVNRPASSMVKQSTGALAKTDENFPALGGGGDTASASTPTFRLNITHQTAASIAGPSNAIIKTAAKPNLSIQVHNRPTTANNFKLEPNKQNTVKSIPSLHEDVKRFDEEFPSLNKKDKNLLASSYSSPLQMSVAAKKVSTNTTTSNVHTISKSLAVQEAPPPPSLSAFPALGPSTFVPKPAQWIVAAKPKDHPPKQSKIAPAPDIPSMTDINSATDFPSLAVNRKNKKSNKTELNNNNSNKQNNEHETVRKEKKKNKNEDAKIKTLSEAINRLRSNQPEKQVKRVIPIDNFENTRSESAWIDSKSKGTADNKNMNQPEKASSPKPNGRQESTKKNVPNLTQDFPALDSSKTIPGFKNAKKSSTQNETNNNVKSKPSYSENLKLKPESERRLENGKDASTANHNSVPPCNGITFTSSSGQSYNIPAHKYLEPPDFNERNHALVVNFMTVLSSDSSIEEFRNVSRQFRDGIYSAESYYEHCKSAIGNEFESLFPELLVLLPDIQKQQELHQIHVKNSKSGLPVCPTCGQVLLLDDYKSHLLSHTLIENFPVLGEPWRK